MDVKVQTCFHPKFEFSDRVDSLADRQKTFFGSCRKLKAADREEEFEKIREEYKKVVEDANEKVQISEVNINFIQVGY